jgi:tRNA-specific 2-thiouridylase
LKFDHLIKKMKELNCDYLATGHYAQIIEMENGQKAIATSEDDWKDQTYFLFTIDPAIVPSLLFPVGHLKKPEVRKIAEERGLVSVAAKKDSTGICFVGNQGYDQFIEKNVPQVEIKKLKGQIRRFPEGTLLGEHQGIHHYTYGQSKGLGLDHHEKLFVIKVDPATLIVWVGDEEHLFKSEATVIEPHELLPVNDGEILSVKIRYARKGSMAKVKKTEQGYSLEFLEKQRAVTPGQAAVFYRDRVLVGGGFILS